MDAVIIILLCVAVLALVYGINKKGVNKRSANFSAPPVPNPVSPFKVTPEVEDMLKNEKDPSKKAVTINSFLASYNSSISESVYSFLLNEQLSGKRIAYIDKKEYDEIIKKEENANILRLSENSVAEYRIKGMEAEKSGDEIMAAINYDLCVRMALSQKVGYAAWGHAAERLVVLYRKSKRYADEMKIIDSVLSQPNLADPVRLKFQERKSKLSKLL